jgi:hypothetical protein
MLVFVGPNRDSIVRYTPFSKTGQYQLCAKNPDVVAGGANALRRPTCLATITKPCSSATNVRGRAKSSRAYEFKKALAFAG